MKYYQNEFISRSQHLQYKAYPIELDFSKRLELEINKMRSELIAREGKISKYTQLQGNRLIHVQRLVRPLQERYFRVFIQN